METYYLERRRFSLSGGSYLLVNDSVPAMNVAIKGAATLSVCVDIDLSLVNDVLMQVLCPDELDNYTNASRFLLTPELLLRQAAAGAPLKQLLTDLIVSSASQSIERPVMELIYELTTMLVQDNLPVINSYYKLQASKLSTRKELFHRLMLGKEMLEDSLFDEISIKQVAETSCLSEFRFYRLFKQCFGDSPYNYLFKRRIEKSIELKKQGHSWSDIAAALNFTDLAAFSKGFKKVKGVAPSKAIS
ncbi:AraC family transcriptional regulator [uncultured Pontibacter sp.]|uniref:helix-turn-helix domain-containing protein n=1 Tax=uncultured Pontibacter sp. TaxID=453356 RepID=UPI002601C6EE|nr:AraC family transcriptional regulator [uncultured Pontibacter sp.]